MADTSQLKAMLNNLINDKPEEATLDLHNYLAGKMRETVGLASSQDVDSGNTIADDTQDEE